VLFDKERATVQINQCVQAEIEIYLAKEFHTQSVSYTVLRSMD